MPTRSGGRTPKKAKEPRIAPSRGDKCAEGALQDSEGILQGSRGAAGRQEIDRVARSWKEDRAPACRDQLVSQHLYLVQAVARKFAGLGESTEDLVSEGMMGLLNAVDLFDPDRGVQFATYATHLIDGQIRHYLRDKSKLIREPAWVQERLTRITRAAEAITHEKGRPAALAEIAESVGLSEAQVRETLKSQERTRVTSLDSVRGAERDDDPRPEMERIAPALQDAVGLEVEDRLFLQAAMGKLKTLEQKVLHHFYYMDLNQTEIARKLGISVNYASYLLRGALSKLKLAFEAQQKIPLEPAAAIGVERRCQPTSTLYSLVSKTEVAATLATETSFRQALAQEALRASRYPQQFAVLLVEPDGAGDWEEEKTAAVMQELALRTRRSVRLVDLVARMGRWRLGLLLPHTGREATVVAERLKTRPLAGGNGATFSVGLAVFPADGSNETLLEEHALQGLLRAQKNGGGQVCRLPANSLPHPAADGAAEKKPTRTRKKKAATSQKAVATGE